MPERRHGAFGRVRTDKGTGYTQDERRRLSLEGLMPPRVESLEEQAARVIGNMRGTTWTSQANRRRLASVK
jgi:hypothetical protein